MRFSHCSAYSFGKKPKCVLEKTDSLYTPSPSHYDPKIINKKNPPKWKIGTEIRVKRMDNNVPGPGQYTPDKKAVLRSSPKYSIASKGEDILKAENDIENISPCYYDPKIPSSSPKYSMGAKVYLNQINDNPGPGSYAVDSKIVVNRVPCYRFGKSKKDGLPCNSNVNVGPGTYENPSIDLYRKKDARYSFGRGRREEMKIDTSPCPGDYEAKQFFGKEGRRSSMGKRLTSSQSETLYFPGPGSYCLTETEKTKFKKSPSYKFGRENRNDVFYRNINKNPSPNEYRPEATISYIRPKTPSWVMGTEKRNMANVSTDNTLGPGTYDLGSSIGKGPKYSMAKKINFDPNKGKTSPGPSEYTINTSLSFNKSPSYKIGTATRDDRIKTIIREDLPGPASYEPNLKHRKSSPQFRFSKGKRNDEIHDDIPGPGYYHIPCSIADVNDYTRVSGTFDPNFRYI